MIPNIKIHEFLVEELGRFKVPFNSTLYKPRKLVVRRYSRVFYDEEQLKKICVDLEKNESTLYELIKICSIFSSAAMPREILEIHFSNEILSNFSTYIGKNHLYRTPDLIGVESLIASDNESKFFLNEDLCNLVYKKLNLEDTKNDLIVLREKIQKALEEIFIFDELNIESYKKVANYSGIAQALVLSGKPHKVNLHYLEFCLCLGNYYLYALVELKQARLIFNKILELLIEAKPYLNEDEFNIFLGRLNSAMGKLALRSSDLKTAEDKYLKANKFFEKIQSKKSIQYVQARNNFRLAKLYALVGDGYGLILIHEIPSNSIIKENKIYLYENFSNLECAAINAKTHEVQRIIIRKEDIGVEYYTAIKLALKEKNEKLNKDHEKAIFNLLNPKGYKPQYQLCLDLYQIALNASTKDHIFYWIVLLNDALTKVSNGKLGNKDAKKIAEEAIENITKIGGQNNVMLAKCLIKLTSVQRRLGNNKESIEDNLNRAEKILLNNFGEKHPEYAKFLTTKLMFCNNYKQYKNLYDLSNGVLEKCFGHESIAIMLLNERAGHVPLDLGDPFLAISHFNTASNIAAKIFKNFGFKRETLQLIAIAAANYQIGDLTEAEKNYNLVLIDEEGAFKEDQDFEARYKYFLGKIKISQGNFYNAKDLLNRSYDLFNRLNQDWQAEEANHQLQIIEFLLGNYFSIYEDPVSVYQRFSNLGKKIDAYDVAEMVFSYANIYMEIGNIKMAENFIELAIKLLGNYKDGFIESPLMAKYYTLLAKISCLKSEYDVAVKRVIDANKIFNTKLWLTYPEYMDLVAVIALIRMRSDITTLSLELTNKENAIFSQETIEQQLKKAKAVGSKNIYTSS